MVFDREIKSIYVIIDKNWSELVMPEKKYIHYCWFGGKPLPKLARKCLESWRRFFPDYEIICWNESNCDFNECEFVKKAYESKQYAFVADYIRTKAIYEMGGIYFDTDMEVVKDPSGLIKKYDSFLGVEDTGKVCCGVWYEKNPKSYLAEKLLKKYQSFKDIDFEKRSEFSIPLLITEILEPCGFDYKKRRVQFLEHGIVVFPREYFYPYSYNRTNNLFTENTYMIHYYDASWIPTKNKIENFLVRRYGRENAIKMIKAYQKTTNTTRQIARITLYPVVLYRKHKKANALIDKAYLDRLDNTVKIINNKKNASYIVLHNGNWFGVTSATKELFDNTIDCGELYRKKDREIIKKAIIDSGVKQVIFSAVSMGWPQLIKMIHEAKPGIKIKVFWHGSMSQVLDKYGWSMHKEIMSLCKKRYITLFATCKKSLFDFYKAQGIRAYFITNKVDQVTKKPTIKRNKDGAIRVGLYAASSSNWRKNMFSQIAAVSMLKNAVLDVVPYDGATINFARRLGVEMTGEPKNLPRKELVERMAKNDVNLYVTFSECSPMLPLESLEVGVPCITGCNHHYFDKGALEKYLVVSQEDSPEAIRDKIKECIDNRKVIISEYKKFRRSNTEHAKENVKSFLEA